MKRILTLILLIAVVFCSGGCLKMFLSCEIGFPSNSSHSSSGDIKTLRKVESSITELNAVSKEIFLFLPSDAKVYGYTYGNGFERLEIEYKPNGSSLKIVFYLDGSSGEGFLSNNPITREIGGLSVKYQVKKRKVSEFYKYETKTEIKASRERVEMIYDYTSASSVCELEAFIEQIFSAKEV